MAMAHSVEGRYPFLDHRIMEFCAALPGNLKLNGLTEKYLLKKLMRNKIPDGIVKRSKQAYRAPISHMINGNRSSEAIKDIISNRNINQYKLFDSAKVEGLKAKYVKGKNISEMDDMALIGIISSQLLYDQFIHNHNKWNPSISNLDIKKDITVS